MNIDEGGCPTFAAWVEAHHEGGEKLASMMAHGRSCSTCSELLPAAASLASELRLPDDGPVPRGMHGRIMGRVRRASWFAPRVWLHGLRRGLVPAIASAAATCLVLLGLMQGPAPAPRGKAPAPGAASSRLHLACLWGRVEEGAVGRWTRVERDVELEGQRSLRVAAGGRAVLRHGEACTVLLEGPCLFHPGAAGARLERGRASFSIRPGAGPYAVETPEGRVTVLGTRFSVAVGAAGRMRVRVDEGRVAVEAGGRSEELVAGQVWGEGVDPSSGAASSSSRTASAEAVSNRVMTRNREGADGPSASASSVTSEEDGTPGPSGRETDEGEPRGPHTVREGF